MALMYHYCSPQTFLQIMEKNHLWLSSMKNMNDFSEGLWVKDAFHKAVTELRKLYGHEWGCQVHDNFIGNYMPRYICCFSKDGDSLSQWRAYAQDGEGIAIGIDDRELSINKHSLTPNLEPLKSLAVEDVKYMSESEIIEDIIRFSKDLNKKTPSKNDAYLVAKYAIDNSIIVKNPAFKEEKERRVIFSYAPSIGYITSDGRSSNPLGEIKFRISNGYLTNHFEYNIPLTAIKEIVLGPKNKFSQYDIDLFLMANARYDVNVKRSSATYR
ncbi:DUF2971 domain-containing protein [Serratia marcescens]|uniref:DUF2971 domain-containing protein n=1 Tax=Serratia TaxID=613 RepID=UPI0007451A62|nr:DUF2971 domain-containing protein [Serratia marcescens]MDX6800676.1 DUF2971 domain-containing protein [Serratia marcescens]MDX6905135.1 DUF2971 domain-containing protein [Serratia marcescens]CUY43072.1 Protein of uncharacterised function (DUF2971) [Serratia marcescens]HEJ9051066.1 DUF2971 domain-containing protein [Serratia marcescens]